MLDSYGARIKAARKKAGLKQKEVAAKMGINERGFSQWESNKRTPILKTLSKIADAFGCEVGELLPDDIKRTQNANTDNPYWERICEIADRQRNKGIQTYGQGLESNPADIVKRIEHLQEELIDGLMYCEWIKDKVLQDIPARMGEADA